MNIMYEKIPFDKVKSEIEKLFPKATLEKWNLLPGDIHKLADSAGITLEWKKIEWWYSFEYECIDISDNKFLSTLFKGFTLKDTQVIIITDECFKDKSAYGLNSKNLTEFIESVYPSIHQMGFFQPNDCIFLLPIDKLLIILDHEGHIMQFQNKQEDTIKF